MLNRTKKRHGLLFFAGLYAVLAVAVVLTTLYYFNNFYLANDKIENMANADTNNYETASTAVANIISEKKYKITGIPVNSTDIFFSYDNKYCIYLYQGIVYVKEIDTNKTVYKIKDSSRIERAVLMDDRNVIIYFTINSNLLQSSKNISITSHDIEKNTKIAQKTFNVGLNTRIKQIDYSSLTNLIFLNIETSVKNKVSDQIYYLNVNEKVSKLSTEKIVNNMVLLGGSFDLYYQDNKGILYCNSKKAGVFENQQINLLGRDSNDNIYVQPWIKKDTVYVISGSKIIRTIHLSDTGFLKLQYGRTGIFAIYDSYIINLENNKDEKIAYDNNYSFTNLINDRIYLKDKNNVIMSLNLEKKAVKVLNNKLPVKNNVVNKKGKVVEPGADLLYGKVICIDPGHQAKSDNMKEPLAPGSHLMKDRVSSGTSGIVTHVPEYALNLDVSLKLRELLLKHKAKVIMTRLTDKVDISNKDRTKIANQAAADIVVRIHADGSNNSSVKGISILVPGSKYIHNSSILTKSKLAAAYTLKAMIASTGAVSRGIVKRDDITGFNWSTVPVFLVEMGFMTNAHEDRLLETPEYQDKLTSGIVKGLEDYFHNSEKFENP